MPESIDDLVRLSVASLSALRLQKSADNDFPKEAAFQHLFDEAISMHTTVENSVVPELTTRAIGPSGEVVTGELDFYINGKLQWGLELLRNGDKIGEHLSRFDEVNGRYRGVEAKQYLVVDCRPSKKGRGAQLGPNRCTLYFEENYTKCRIQMRCQAEELVNLQP